MDELEMFQQLRPEGSALDTIERAEIRADLFGPIQPKDSAAASSRTDGQAVSWLTVDMAKPARRYSSPWTIAATIVVVIVGGGGVWIASTNDPVNQDAVATSSQPADETSAPTTTIDAAATTPIAPSPVTETSAPLTYVIKDGDYPATVAERFNVTSAELAAANALSFDGPTIDWPPSGTTILIPGAQTMTWLDVMRVDGLETAEVDVNAEAGSLNGSGTIEIAFGEAPVMVGMPVVNELGLVGKVESIDEAGAVVRLITSPEFQIGATSVGPAASLGGVVTGNGEPFTATLRVPEGAGKPQVATGTLVVTAGGPSSISPPGVPIGQIAERSAGVENSDSVAIDLFWNDQADLSLHVLLYIPG